MAVVMESDTTGYTGMLAAFRQILGYAISAAKVLDILIPDSIEVAFGATFGYLLSPGDDLIQAQTLQIPAATLAAFGSSPPVSWNGIPFHFATRHRGSGADYYAVFRITSQSVAAPSMRTE